jgi:hypothetical protein
MEFCLILEHLYLCLPHSLIYLFFFLSLLLVQLDSGQVLEGVVVVDLEREGVMEKRTSPLPVRCTLMKFVLGRSNLCPKRFLNIFSFTFVS